MTTRLYDPKDYAVISPWWEAHGGKIVPEEILPQCAVVVEYNDKLAAAAWLYMDNSVGVAWMSWMVTNPEFGPIKAAKSLTVLLKGMEELCSEFNYGLLFTSSNSKGVGQWLARQGFSQNHQGMTQYFKKV